MTNAAMNRRSFIRTGALATAAALSTAGLAFADEPQAPAGPAPEGAEVPEAAGAGAPGGAPGGFGAPVAPGSMDTVPWDYQPGVGEYPLGVPAGTPEGLEWMNIPAPITSVAEEREADVVVVGAGIAGLAAARAALEAGASVIVVEATDTWNGRGLDVGTFNAANQIEVGFETDEDGLNDVCLEMTRYAGNRASQAIMRTWAHRCGSDFDWFFRDLLAPKGYTVELARWPLEVDYEPVEGEWIPQFISANEIAAPEGSAGFGGLGTAIGEMGTYAQELGAEFVFNTRARQLVRGDDNVTGRVGAVIAEGPDGSYIKFNAAKGVVLATGDYGSNPDLMAVWCPSLAPLAARSPLPWATSQGDGHSWACGWAA